MHQAQPLPTVIGGTGKDTVDLLSGESAAANLRIELKGGQDSIAVSGLAMSGSILGGGAGADTFAFSGAATEINTVLGGDGNDVVNIAGAIDFGALKVGGGADVISGSCRLRKWCHHCAGCWSRHSEHLSQAHLQAQMLSQAAVLTASPSHLVLPLLQSRSCTPLALSVRTPFAFSADKPPMN